jgi:hypothetical protein
MHSVDRVRGFPSDYTRVARPSGSLFEELEKEQSPVHPLKFVDDVCRWETIKKINGCGRFEI